MAGPPVRWPVLDPLAAYTSKTDYIWFQDGSVKELTELLKNLNDVAPNQVKNSNTVFLHMEIIYKLWRTKFCKEGFQLMLLLFLWHFCNISVCSEASSLDLIDMTEKFLHWQTLAWNMTEFSHQRTLTLEHDQKNISVMFTNFGHFHSVKWVLLFAAFNFRY